MTSDASGRKKQPREKRKKEIESSSIIEPFSGTIMTHKHTSPSLNDLLSTC
jgi:hypothetical protein